MRTLIAALALSVSAFPARGSEREADREPPVTVVDSVDLERYVGLWYEIARIPNRFQKRCVRATTAEYSLREDGRIEVLNRCYREDGDRDEAGGVAKITDTETSAKLEVSFVSFLGWRPFWGHYWIIGLDDGYQWAAIGTPDRKYGWILARTPELADDTLDRIFAVFDRNGYERASFVASPQD